jgi:hypothetical protein
MVASVVVPYMPTGWLSMLQRGFLHRDISIGNALMSDPFEEIPPFEVQNLEKFVAQLRLPDAEKLNAELAGYTHKLEREIKLATPLGECHGFLIDGDMAAPLTSYFSNRDKGKISVCVLSSAGNSN